MLFVEIINAITASLIDKPDLIEIATIIPDCHTL
jgi:predicted RNA-binding protein YlqC (UPF0109 family)